MAASLRIARLGILALTATTLATAPATAQTVGSFADLPSVLKLGTQVSVQGDDGQKVTGKVVNLSDATITVQRGGALPMPYQFERERVVKVTGVDSTTDGFWGGFAAGVVPGVLLAAGVNTYCYNEGPHHCPGAFFVIGGATGLVGGLIGKAIDGAVHHGPVLYSRQAPRASRATFHPFATPDRRGGGLLVSMAF